MHWSLFSATTPSIIITTGFIISFNTVCYIPKTKIFYYLCLPYQRVSPQEYNVTATITRHLVLVVASDKISLIPRLDSQSIIIIGTM